MATYNLNAGDLITLLKSTVTDPSQNAILAQLAINGELTNNTNGVFTQLYNSSGTTLVPSGTILDLLTLPTSTSIAGSSYPAPTVGPATPSNDITLVSQGGLIVAAGDQADSVFDVDTGATDTLLGGAGFERLEVEVGNASIVGGTGQNTLVGGYGMDTLTAGTGNQRLVAGLGGSTLYGGSGTDTLVGNFGASIVAGSGATRIVSTNTPVTPAGIRGSETVVAGSGSDTIVASASNFALNVSIGSGFSLYRDVTGANSTVTGSTGTARVVLGTTGSDTINSGTGNITINSSQSSLNLTSNSSTAVGGAHTLTFNNGQVIQVNDANSNVVIHFLTGGGTTPV
jgi:Ca2+-binding RTX toxin-like protein